MKRKMLSIAIVGLLFAAPLLANTVENASVDDTGELKGPAIGMLIGGVFGGPPGLVVGAIGGALIGKIDGQKTVLSLQQDQLAASRQHVQQLQQHSGSQSEQIERQERQQQERQQAVAEGFSFCLQFRTESADLEPRFQPQLDALAGMLNAFPGLDIKILASADHRGSDDYNRELSKLRAETVSQRLVAAGVDAGRIQHRIEGEGMALYPTVDLEGLGFDRFVLLSFIPVAGR
ncbi:MAG: OmpA family protein [Gammaproteobacteria bacterium (ex Lamellibrachia satsuma)]|nr:MAG: OmpA family protein [Gammaproteobacteria bacterium (ex Lamellibrachia satsuma)]